jgi:hypothetical protein
MSHAIVDRSDMDDWACRLAQQGEATFSTAWSSRPTFGVRDGQAGMSLDACARSWKVRRIACQVHVPKCKTVLVVDFVLHDVPVLREAPAVDAEDVDDDPGRPPTSAEASVNHRVVALGDGQRTFVPPVDGAHQGEQAIASRPDPGDGMIEESWYVPSTLGAVTTTRPTRLGPARSACFASSSPSRSVRARVANS